MRNIFSSLNKYLVRQTENFLTEGFTYVLDVLVTKETKSAQELLNHISGIDLQLEPSSLTIATQESTETGRPDLVIRQLKDFTLFIEIKHDSAIGVKQLERYFDELELSESYIKQLVLVTRSKHSLKQTGLDRSRFRHICWYQISGWMSELKVEDQVSRYTIEQFLKFLEEKEMTTEKVGWEYIRGVSALVHLSNMLETALAEALPEAEPRKSAGWKEFGFYFGKEKAGWLGIQYNDHLLVYVAKAGPNQDYEEEYLTFNLEKSPFFTLQAGEQLEMLIQFIKDSVSELGIMVKNEV